MDNQYSLGVFHGDEKLNNMLNQMVRHDDPYRLVYRWVVKRDLSFREFVDLMKTYNGMTQH